MSYLLRPSADRLLLLLALASLHALCIVRPACAQNGIVFAGPLGNDLTDPEDNGVLDATVTSGGSSPSGERSLEAVDNTSSSKWLSFEPDGTFFQIQLDTASLLRGYSLTSANDAEERDPYAWTLLGSNNGVSFTQIDNRTAVDFVDRFETQLFSLESPSASYEYFRFEFLTERGAGGPNPGTPNSIQIAEIELFSDDRRPLLGDIDDDGDVDLNEVFVSPGDTAATDGISDANILRDALGNVVPADQGGDLDGDRLVTLLDFRILKNNLQGPASGQLVVPEPSTLVLSMVLLSVLLGVRRGSQRPNPCAAKTVHWPLILLIALAFQTRSHAADPIATIITTNETTTNFTQVLDYQVNSDLDQPFNEGGIARSNTVFNSVLRKNSNARDDQGRVMALIEPEQRGSVKSQGGAFLEQYTFTHWQYIDKFVDWGGTSEGNIKIPRSGWIDAAHRNGVKIYGNVFLAPTVFGGSVDQVEYLIQKNNDGNFPVADQLIEIAEAQGFDGYFLNQEVNGVGSAIAEQVGQFMDYIQANSNVELIWYDAQTEAGFVGWQEELNSQNDRFFQNNGNVVSQAMFLDFGASTFELSTSKTVANNLGRSEFDLYAGTLLEANGIAAGAGQLLNSFAGPGGNHRSSLALFRPDNAPWEAATASENFDVQAMIAEDQKIYVGATGDPSNTSSAVAGTNWRGIANYVAAKSPLVNDTFMTNFNFGLGKQYAIEGEVSSVGNWNNIGLQDVLPTWRWIVATSDPTPLDVAYDFDEAYHGGNSLRIEGSLDDDTEVPLYLAEMPIFNDSKLTIAFKTGEVGETSAELVVEFKGAEGAPVSFPLGITTTGGWNTQTFDLTSHAGNEIASLGLKFLDNNDPSYRLNVGRLGLVRGSIDIPAAPTNATAQSVGIEDGAVADVRLLWDHSTDYSRDQNNKVYNYNVFRRDAVGTRSFLGGAATNAYFVDGLQRGDGELVTVLEIETVGNEFGVSAAEEFRVRWETNAVITIDRQTGEVVLANPLADPTALSEYTISATAGNLDEAGWRSLADQNLSQWQETTANSSTLSETLAGGSFQVGADGAISLGQAFVPTELAFGVDSEDVSFSYLSDGQTIDANVVFMGDSSNNLTIYINPETGEATLQNTSSFDAMIDAYQVLSAAGSLNPDDWQSLADEAIPGWEESNPSVNQLAELNFSDALLIRSGEAYDLGTAFVPGMRQDLSFEFFLDGATVPMAGRIVYRPPGDFDRDSDVDGNDFLLIQRNNPSLISLWQEQYSVDAAPLAAIPEPSTLAMTVVLTVVRCAAANRWCQTPH